MPDENTVEYYAKREAQERELAEAATDPAIQAIHLDLAKRYANLQDEAAQGRSRLSLFKEA
ncbi:hypothetical protein [Sphingomonas sp. UYEF23]|uniref:hypothetical protein n=1 Tax=Sphingomonas sp. UYEF23 TaxID=1756408 RepID=UPI003395014B